MGGKVLNRSEVIEALKAGDYILWLGGATFSACLGSDFSKTVRRDTLLKLREDKLITNFGYPQLSGKVYLKEAYDKATEGERQ